jgi:hypothetical protein
MLFALSFLMIGYMLLSLKEHCNPRISLGRRRLFRG